TSKAAPAPAPTLPVSEPLPANAPAVNAPQTGAAKKDKATTIATTDAQPPATADAPAADGNDVQGDASGKSAAPAQPTQSHGPRPAAPHRRPRGRDEAQKPDDLLSQSFGAPANPAAHGGKPPTEAMHAVLQAADGLAGAATAANTGVAPPSQGTPDP